MILGLALVGGHLTDGDLYDAMDLAVQTDAGTVAVGIRTDHYVAGGDPNRDWDGYAPIPIDFDARAVRYWDFNTILWLGPEPRPCVIWSNAAGFRIEAMHTVLSIGRVEALIAGRDGGGLPSYADLGRELPDDLVFVALEPVTLG